MSSFIYNTDIAKVCHQANKALCESNNDYSHLDWEKEINSGKQESTLNGVNFRILNPNLGFEDQHNAWMKDKLENGWTYGEEKNVEKKKHPCLVPYNQLSEFQKMKDKLFIAIVDALNNQE